jgi:FtsP/CotA-like multicopper oxidase with cupredoxin domain
MRLLPQLTIPAVALTATAGFAIFRPAPLVVSSDAPIIVANQNRTAAGSVKNGVLTLALEVREGRWFPNAEEGQGLQVLAFAEAGHQPQNPGPLIRVPAGTEIHVTLSNLGRKPVTIHGLFNRPAGRHDSMVLAPQARGQAQFRLDVPGTYYYWGSTTGQPVDLRDGEDSQLSGAIVVDPPGKPPAPDRIFVLGLWSRPADYPDRTIDSLQEIMVINGKGWPNTERLQFVQGDTVRWRWVNPTSSSHPMHLHGVYFELQSRGDGIDDTLYDQAHRFLEVTELIYPGGTAGLQWVPDRAGHWLFHCHFSGHISPDVSLPAASRPHAQMAGVAPARPGAAFWHHAMGGLVMGLTVLPRAGAPAAAESTAEPRQLRLLVQTRANQYGTAPGYGYVLQTGSDEPARDSIVIPGAPLILTRGQPVRVTIVNHLTDVTAVHWHGIELESPSDGVPGWSGIPPSVTPPIAPEDSFVAAFTPPRAGTFIYHTHMNELEQMHLGLYGALIVLEPGTTWNPDSEHVVIVSPDGEATDSTRGLINGSATPPPLRIKAGTVHRLRLINIHGDYRIRFVLRQGGRPVSWRPVAKDGADLPPALAQSRPAELVTGPGETEDVEIQAAAPGEWVLEVSAPFADPVWTREMRVVAE